MTLLLLLLLLLLQVTLAASKVGSTLVQGVKAARHVQCAPQTAGCVQRLEAPR
jgi:hypothetical protein